MPPPLSPLPPSPPCVRSSTARSQGAGGGPARGQTPLLTAVPPAGGPLCDDFLCLLTIFRRAATRPDRGAGIDIDIVVIELGFTSWTSLCGSFSAPRPFPPSSHHSPPPPHHRGTCRGSRGEAGLGRLAPATGATAAVVLAPPLCQTGGRGGPAGRWASVDRPSPRPRAWQRHGCWQGRRGRGPSEKEYGEKKPRRQSRATTRTDAPPASRHAA